MADKKKKETKPKYNVKDGKIERKNQACPKCGEGTFMAEHAKRMHCGKCGYTKWK